MLRKSVSALMGAAALVASVSAASANSITIYDNPGFSSGYSFSAPSFSKHSFPNAGSVFHNKATHDFKNWFDAAKYNPYINGAHINGVYVPGQYKGFVPSIRPIARPVWGTVVVVKDPAPTPVAIETVEIETVPVPVNTVVVNGVTIEPTPKLVLECIVAGTPVEAPNDIYISNPYDVATPADLEVSYKAADDSEGLAILPAIEPGEGVYISSAIEEGMEPGTACSAIEA